MKYFFAWFSNKVDNRDDEPIKIRAKDKRQAQKIAIEEMNSCRFSLRNVYTAKQFKRIEPWWHAHFWGQKAINENTSC